MKISKDKMTEIQDNLQVINSSWQTEYNWRDIVGECFVLIERARKYKVSWEEISKIIRESSGITDAISPYSISKYYLDLEKEKKRSREKRKANTKKSVQSITNKDNRIFTNWGAQFVTNESKQTVVKQESFHNKITKKNDIFTETIDENCDLVLEAIDPKSGQQIEAIVENRVDLEVPPKAPDFGMQETHQPVETELPPKAKDDIRAQFNLGRRKT